MQKKKYLESKGLSILLFFTVFIFYSVVYMTKNMFSAAMAAIVEEGAMTKSQVGLINAVFWLVYAAFQLVGGVAADKFSPYKLIIIGSVGGILSNLIIYFNQDYNVILLAWIFNAVAQFGLWPAVFKTVTTQLMPEIRRIGLFWLLFGTSVGLALSMLVASYVTDWRQNFIIASVSLLVMLALYIVVYKSLERHMVVEENVEIKDEKAVSSQRMNWNGLYKSGLILIIVVAFLRTAVDNGIKMVTPVMLMESYDSLPAAIATRLSSILVIFSMLGVFFTRFTQIRISDNEMKGGGFAISLSIIPLAVACFVGKIGYIFILLALCVAMVFVHGASSLTNSFAASRYARVDRAGTVAGILNASASLGNVFASYFFVRVAELAPWNWIAILWTSFMMISAILCVCMFGKWTKFIG